MTTRMPRGAIPSSRSDIAAADPYRPGGGVEVLVPTGEFPSPNHELAGAERYKGGGSVPESFTAWPTKLGFWGNETRANSIWAEEAFSKACVEPRVFIPTEAVLSASRECGSSNFSAFMQTHGFRVDREAYLDGPFSLINWTDAAALNGAIANVGPVKIGVASKSSALPLAARSRPGRAAGRSTASRRASLEISARAFAATGRWLRWSISSSGTGLTSICRPECLRDSPTRCLSLARSASSTGNC